MKGERGMVLVSVLWVILILSLVSFSLAAAVRVEVASAQQSFDGERALFMAQGAAEIIFNAYSKDQPIPTDSPIRQGNNEYVIPFDSGEAHVHFESDAGLIDINKASDKLLASMFDSLGVNQERRNHLVDSILDWRDADDIPHLYGAEVGDYPENVPGQPPTRPRNGDFQAVEELLMVKNVTPEIFFGSFVSDPVSGAYLRIPGVRELVTVRTASDKVSINVASAAALSALPAMNPQLAAALIVERARKPYSDAEDLVSRVPALVGKDTLDYLSFDKPQPSALVSRATISSSGISKTVRLLFKREEKLHVITFSPYVYKRTNQAVPDRWRID